MRKILKAIDASNEYTAWAAKWIAVLIVLVICTEVFLRYVLGSPTIQLPEVMIMAGTALYTLSWGYIYRQQRHVRVDVVYGRLSPKGKAIIDVIGGVIWLLPLVILLTYGAGKYVIFSWSHMERSPWHHWYPILGPIRTIFFLGVLLFTLQAFAQFFRDLYLLIRKRDYDSFEP